MANNITTLHDVHINSFSHDGRGIGLSPEGKTIFVVGALPNERVDIEITKKHSRYLEAKLIGITTSSPDRITAPCPHYLVCGGCSMQHMTMPAQINLKQKILFDQLKHFGRVTPLQIMPPILANNWGYRRKARLGVKYVRKKGKVLVGFREKNSAVLADIKKCLVLHPLIGENLQRLSEVVRSLSKFEAIPQIEVAVGDNNQAALFFRVMDTLTPEDHQKLITFAQEMQIHLYIQPNANEPTYKLWPQDDNPYLTYSLPNQHIQFDFHPLDFTQVNGEINPLMIDSALALLNPQSHETVLDLFCGLGNFTLPIAQRAKCVVGVEGSELMVQRGTHNALKNNIQNVAFYAANLASKHFSEHAWLQQTYDKVLLDPPRTGALEIIQLFPQLQPKTIVYVSCNPATLARDIQELVHKQNYVLEKVGLINMFPHTGHSETIALLQKSKD
jgi:23S rRNA (uracil1939-C5)-methyltransferase